MNSYTFEQKLAYEIGVKLAHEAYMEKQASWQAFKTLGSGLKGVATGQGSTMSQAFKSGTKGQGFKQTMGNIREGLVNPWREAYRTYGARQGAKQVQSLGKDVTKQRQALEAAQKANDPAAIASAQKALAASKKTQSAAHKQLNQTYQATGGLKSTARRGYIPRKVDTQAVADAKQNLKMLGHAKGTDQYAQAQAALQAAQKGTVNWGQVGTMATGAGLAAGAGYGAYNLAGNAMGGSNYQPPPQQAPHQYYMNQLSNWWNN
tara:strand:+ start:4123 stop:4908 length:786 start_codon:yes stop_codon:yes gene_type:complete